MTYGFVRMRATLGDSSLCRRNETAARLSTTTTTTTVSYNKTRWNDQLPDHPSLFLFLSHAFHLSVQVSPPLIRELKFAGPWCGASTWSPIEKRKRKGKKRGREADRYLSCAFDESRNTRTGRVNGSRRRDDPPFPSVNRYRITGHWMFGGSYESLFRLVQLVGRI